MRVGETESVQCLGYGLDNRGSIPGRGKEVNFSLPHRVQTGLGTHPVGTDGSYNGDEVDVVRLKVSGATPPLPHASSLRCTQAQ
jgi:hypothetical protein